MVDRSITEDDLVWEIDDHLMECDAPYFAALAKKVLGGDYASLSNR